MQRPTLKQFTVTNLGFERNNQLLFNNLDCTLAAGELLQIRGANGSGKSTLLRILAGFIAPLCGKVLWAGEAIDPQQLHYAGHQNGIKLNLTVRENLQLQIALAISKFDSAHIDAVIKKIGLSAASHKQALHLSAGQLRRLALARLLLNPLPVWMLDEPTTALDAEGQQLLIELLSQHMKNNGIAIVATHQTLSLTCPTKTIDLGEQHV